MSEETAPAEVEARRTAPIGLLVDAFGSVGQLVPSVALAFFALRNSSISMFFAIPLILVIAGAQLFFAWLRWHRTTYHIGAEDIRVESGLLSRAARSVPYERIQDVSLEQKLLPRMLGLVSVRFETGAGGEDELSLAYLKEDGGEQLRNLIRARKEGAHEGHEATYGDAVQGEMALASAGGKALSDQPASTQTQYDQTLFEMGPRRLITFGLFEFSLAIMVVFFGLAQQFDFLLPFDFWDFDAWKQGLEAPGERIAGLGIAGKIIGGIFAVLSILGVGIVAGMIRTILRDWGFRLDKTPQGFRRRRGLLTRTDVVMPIHRVQAMLLDTGIFRRRFGWHGLNFFSLAQDAGASNHDVAPFAKREELWPIAEIAGFHRPREDMQWYNASRKYRMDRICLGLLIPVFTFVLAFAMDRAIFALIPVGVAMMVAAKRMIDWDNALYGADPRQIFIRRSWLAPRLEIAPQVKLQSVEFSQGPLARRHGYGTLYLGLAGGKMSIPGLPVAQALELRRAIIKNIVTTDFSALNGK